MYKTVSSPALELFEKVWSTPVLKLAREIGVSDVALGKACRKAGIAVPRRGHWTKPEEKSPKKPAPPTSDQVVSFHVLDRSLFPPTPAKTTNEAPPPPKVPVPESQVDPHPLVARWRKVEEMLAGTFAGADSPENSRSLPLRNLSLVPIDRRPMIPLAIQLVWKHPRQTRQALNCQHAEDANEHQER